MDDGEDDEDMEIAGVQIGTAVPKDKSKPICVALKVKDCEIYIKSVDAMDVAKSLMECAEYVENLNKERTVQ